MANSTDSNGITFRLPDGDRVAITWPYVLEQITSFITGVTTAIQLENIALQQIDNKIDEWLEE
jgi:hypothetical protein